MSREWKPGDVALVEIGCWANRHVAIVDGSGWRYGDGKWVKDDPAIVTARPLVVIDPEDREQVERLLDLYCESRASGSGDWRTWIEAALRDFADPKPPKPAEPTGLGAVVEDADGTRWVRVLHETTPWVDGRSFPQWWRNLNAVRVLSEGVTA